MRDRWHKNERWERRVDGMKIWEVSLESNSTLKVWVVDDKTNNFWMKYLQKNPQNSN